MVRETVRCLRTLIILLFVAAITAAPTIELTTVPVSDADNTTLSTELQPPPLPQEEEHHYVVFIVNMFGVNNASGETFDEIMQNENFTEFIVYRMFNYKWEKIQMILEADIKPLGSLLLIVEVDDNDEETNVPVNLDEVANDLETSEGLHVEKIYKAGETNMLKVKLDNAGANSIIPSKNKLDKMKKVRNRRTPCLKCHSKTSTYPEYGGGNSYGGNNGYGNGGGYGGGGGFGGGYGGGGGYGSGGGGGYGTGGGGGYGTGGGRGGYGNTGYGNNGYGNSGYGNGGCGGGGCGGGYPGRGGGYPSGGGCSTCGGGGGVNAHVATSVDVNTHWYV
ncbi:hypothetical protein ANTQUA_LOCUS2910 [Anthophora quadrimaculata]